MEERNESIVRCPKCNSTQITANKKGFSGKKAVVGGLLTGGIGILAGTIGSNKIKITCLNCGHVFNPGDKTIEKNESDIEKLQSIKKHFYNAYESGYKEEGFELLKKSNLLRNYANADEAYTSLKKADKNGTIGCIIFVVILAIIIAIVTKARQ